jgi:threonine/homoserine/homoserine lactone efflux protein
MDLLGHLWIFRTSMNSFYIEPNKFLIIFEKLGLGITLAAPIGPVSIEMIKRGLRNGFWASFNIRLGAAIGNTLCLIGTYLGLSQIMGNSKIMTILGLFGAILLLYMGITTFRKSATVIDLSIPTANTKNGLMCGFYLSIISPVALVFWPGIFAASMGSADTINLTNFLLNLFIIVGVLIWGVGLSLVLSFCRNILNKKFINILTKIAALLMIFYGLKYAYCVYTHYT